MDKSNYTLSVIIPCYNERDNILKIVKKVRGVDIPRLEIIVVNDKSTDGTDEVLEKEVRPLVSRVVTHETNQGKGGAIRTGIGYATGDIVIIQDADMEYDPQDYIKVLSPILDGRCRVCYGSRFMAHSLLRLGENPANHLANFALTLLSNLFTHQRLTDMETCYKAFRSDVIKKVDITEKRFGFEPEITAKISKMGIKIHEVPISYAPRSARDRKKIGFKDGLRAIYCILKYR